jgi:hypothetical protein
MHDFSTSEFPEDAFPPVSEQARDHQRICQRGRAVMARSRVAITGLARNLGAILPTTIARIERLGSLFADHRVIVYENDSTDDTKLILRSWAARNRRIHVMTEDCSDPVNPTTRCLHRIERMARYRTHCQDAVRALCPDYDFTIVIDLDVAGGWSEDGVANTFGHEGWDFVGANGLIYRREGLDFNALRQYDMWALRFDEALTPLPTQDAHRYRFRVGEPLVPVTSCFGGMGIYTMSAYLAGRYAASDCEHVAYHRGLVGGGYRRLFLNPSQVLVYGRRRRFGDGIVAGILGAWDRASGRPTHRWQFPPRRDGRRAA